MESAVAFRMAGSAAVKGTAKGSTITFTRPMWLSWRTMNSSVPRAVVWAARCASSTDIVVAWRLSTEASAAIRIPLTAMETSISMRVNPL
jgi:hypothetical protein